MTTERERIEKLLADGKVSAEEAERLRAALEKSEREEAQAPRNAEEKITRPRLSKLAAAGALGLPAAVVAFLLLAGIAILCGLPDDRAAQGGLFVAAAVILTGAGLSIAGRIAIRRAPDGLTGLRAARFGIIAPTVTGAVALVAVSVLLILDSHKRERIRLAEIEAEREEAESIREDDEARRRCKEGRAASDVFSRFQSLCIFASPRPGEFLLRLELLEPGWADDYRAGRIAEEEMRDTALDAVFLNATCGSWRVNAEISAQMDRGYVVMEGEDHVLRIPVRKVGSEWLLARRKVEYRFERGSTAKMKIEASRIMLRNIREAWARLTALVISGDARAEDLHEFMPSHVVERITKDTATREDLENTVMADSFAEFLRRRKRDKASFWETYVGLSSGGNESGSIFVTNGDAYVKAMLQKIDGRWRFENFRFRLPAVRSPVDDGGPKERKGSPAPAVGGGERGKP